MMGEGYHEVEAVNGHPCFQCDDCPEFVTTNERLLEEHRQLVHLNFSGSGNVILTDKDGRPTK